MNQPGPAGSVNPVWIVVGAVLLFAILVGGIRRGNRRQRPILWLAFFVCAGMALYPPWRGEAFRLVDENEGSGPGDLQYVSFTVSMGYAPLWNPPKPGYTHTLRPMRINWLRLLLQLAAVVVLTAVTVTAYRSKPTPWRPEDETASDEPPDPASG